jgi:hypothetical protein
MTLTMEVSTDRPQKGVKKTERLCAFFRAFTFNNHIKHRAKHAKPALKSIFVVISQVCEKGSALSEPCPVAVPCLPSPQTLTSLRPSPPPSPLHRRPPPQFSLTPTSAPAVHKKPHAPKRFLCPITREVMTDPVTAADGHTYDRAAILRWFLTRGRTSPLTGLSLLATTLTSNLRLRKEIAHWRAEQRQRAAVSDPEPEPLAAAAVAAARRGAWDAAHLPWRTISASDKDWVRDSCRGRGRKLRTRRGVCTGSWSAAPPPPPTCVVCCC